MSPGVTGRLAPVTAIEIVNPLPVALAHYESELTDVLRRTGVGVSVHAVSSGERSGADVWLPQLLARVLRERLTGHPPAPGTHRLVVWPLLGFPELVAWRGRAADTSVIVHDPEPLRRQVGLGALPVRLTRLATRLRPQRQLLTHSDAALAVVEAHGFRGLVLPHPVLAPTPRAASNASRRVLVLGQFKDTRDTGLLPELGGTLRSRGYQTAIVGRGWPRIEGWDVDARFVDEAQFDQQLESAAAVVLPYTRVFQSGVAVRAAERSVPVVGGRGTNVAELYGAGWPGLVDDDADPASWVAAVDHVASADPGAVTRQVEAHHTACLNAWSTWVAKVRAQRVAASGRPAG